MTPTAAQITEAQRIINQVGVPTDKVVADVAQLIAAGDEWRTECIKYHVAEQDTDELINFIHARQLHPGYEYQTTNGPRKAFYEQPPTGEGWEKNKAMGRDGWERFEYHEEAYWRRKKRT